MGLTLPLWRLPLGLREMMKIDSVFAAKLREAAEVSLTQFEFEYFSKSFAKMDETSYGANGYLANSLKDADVQKYNGAVGSGDWFSYLTPTGVGISYPTTKLYGNYLIIEVPYFR